MMLALAACASPAAEITLSTTPPDEEPILLAAGDIVRCSDEAHHRTAEILDRYPDATVQTLGDNAYNSGTARQFGCYDETWGRAYERTRPALGGHDYRTAGAAGYMDYFREVLEPMGDSATDPDRGWYVYELGAWRIYVLNSICQEVAGGCADGSPQVEWLREDLSARPTTCVAAVIHNPRFSSGRKGNEDEVQPLWEALYEGGAEFVLSGDNHAYERLAPMTPDGEPDPERGIRQFVVGTGGGRLYLFSEGPANPNSEVGNDNTFGVLKLTLGTDGYAWEFLPEAGKEFTDTGTADCH
jgi:acid phosphatase type 7